jgi:oligopeptide transport system substrate-binding protein
MITNNYRHTSHTFAARIAGHTAIVVSLLAMLLSLACSNQVAQTKPIETAKVAKIARPTLAAASPLPAEVPPSGTLNLNAGDPDSLDPAQRSYTWVRSIFSGLVCLNDSMLPCGDIATNLTVSEDGKTYTFILRPDVTFHNGRLVTAEDFKFSWERACNPATKSKTASSFLGDISGADDVLSGKSSTITGITVVDNTTLKVELKAPETYFLYKLTYPVTFVVDRANVAAGANWWYKANGTGPFKLSKYEKGDSLILGRNSSYYGEKAKLETVKYQILSGRTIDLYEKEKIDIAGIDLNYIDKATDNSSQFSKELHITPALNISFIGFNCKSPPFDDENVRRAFALAIDKNKIISVTLKNTSRNANGLLPPGIPGYDPDLHAQEFDPLKAKELLSKSKYAASLPHITMTTAGIGNNTAPIQEAIIAEWRTNLGIDVDIRQIESDRYYDHLREEKDQIFMVSWVADYPHPQNILGILFDSKSKQNYGEFSSAKLDYLLAEGAQETDPNQIAKIYGQANRQLIDDSACIPLVFGNYFLLVKPYVNGYVLDELDTVHLNRISIKPH